MATKLQSALATIRAKNGTTVKPVTDLEQRRIEVAGAKEVAAGI